ncbi:HTH-type transcriptional repressor YvoA [Oceanobacillus oncorhynchi]|uniref:HTH-type transcriptional repressor YvoA n=1 Tax=Oceanobacillus oncorhynchi TaxID=545501 RepID=A0A0A1MP81_9BACI|nr:GntR family transcriptional regulator [Oceanobacillus oncorhynchi]CEI80871.1 HTH-type transcriptional repressor YvoA [Oceanobacillus oncorhynchi]
MRDFLNKNSSIPLYYQVKEVIKEKIKSEEWKNDEKIPNELELVEQFNVSRSTVRQAILELVNEGLLTRKKGHGTFVKKLQHEGNFMTFSYPDELGKKHIPISAKVIEGPLEYLHIFKLYNSKKINETIRLRYFKEDPAIIERTYLPYYLFPDILNKDMEKPIYDTVIDDYKINIIRHKVYIEPILLDEYDANLLGVDSGQPALKTTKICETSNNLPILLTISIFREDRSKLFFQYDV